MSSRATLKSVPARRRTTKTFNAPTAQIQSMERMQAGSKVGLISMMESKMHGITNSIPKDMTEQYTADELYEIVYGGSSDYFQGQVFDMYREEEDMFIRSLTREINVQESIYKCSNCGYDRIRLKQEQQGGGDESMTSLYRCARCSHSWTNNGRGG